MSNRVPRPDERGTQVFDFHKFRAIRNQRRFTQMEMAEILGCSQSYVSRLESGQIDAPDIRYLQQIANALHLPLNALLIRSDDYLSVFIIYGQPDKIFASALNDALKAHGVPSFFFPESAPPGQRLHRTMAQGINENDRVLLICSRDSLGRYGVLNELEQVLAREAREGGAELLIPVTIDEFVFDGWRPDREDIATQVRDRVIADFRGVSPATREFERGMSRILHQLVRANSS